MLSSMTPTGSSGVRFGQFFIPAVTGGCCRSGGHRQHSGVVTSNLSLNMAAKFTWVTSGPTSTSTFTTGTSTSTVRYTTANP